MIEENLKIVEEEKIQEGLNGETSTPETETNPVMDAPEENASAPVSLNTEIQPTEEEIEAAGLEVSDTGDNTVAPENPVTEETPVMDAPENPESDVTENSFSIDGQATKMFTQSQVDEIAGKTRVDTREKTYRYIYGRYGVNSEEELDELVGKAQRHDLLLEEYNTAKADWESRNRELAEIKEQVALMQSGIDSARYEDAKLILRGKGLEINVENIQRELSTHPEWKITEEKVPEKPVAKVVPVLGNETPVSKISSENEEEQYALNNIFKV